MDEAAVGQIAQFIKDLLKGRDITVDEIIVFGSYARGNYTKDSDLDMAVISRDFNGKDVFQKARMLKGLKWALVEKFELSFDIVALSLKQWRESSSLVVDFVREGKVLSLS